MKLRELLTPRRSSRRPRKDAPRHIVPPPADPFDAARARLKAKIPPRRD